MHSCVSVRWMDKSPVPFPGYGDLHFMKKGVQVGLARYGTDLKGLTK